MSKRDFSRAPLRSGLLKALRSFAAIAPMLLAVVGLIGLFKSYVTPRMLMRFFDGSALHDMAVGVAAGAVSVGQPFLSYIIGGELLDAGASIYGVVAFILSFVTLGIVQLPMEAEIFGLPFTIKRNLLSLFFAFALSWAIVAIVKGLG